MGQCLRLVRTKLSWFCDVVPHFSYATYNDLDSVKALVTEDTAAVMLELVQGESGVRPADKTFVTALSEFCQIQGFAIVDEVQQVWDVLGNSFHLNIMALSQTFYFGKRSWKWRASWCNDCKENLVQLFLMAVMGQPLVAINLSCQQPQAY